VGADKRGEIIPGNVYYFRGIRKSPPSSSFPNRTHCVSYFSYYYYYCYHHSYIYIYKTRLSRAAVVKSNGATVKSVTALHSWRREDARHCVIIVLYLGVVTTAITRCPKPNAARKLDYPGLARRDILYGEGDHRMSKTRACEFPRHVYVVHERRCRMLRMLRLARRGSLGTHARQAYTTTNANTVSISPGNCAHKRNAIRIFVLSA